MASGLTMLAVSLLVLLAALGWVLRLVNGSKRRNAP